MDYKFETRCIHRENEHEEGHPYGSVCTPIYQTATFYHPGIGQTTGFDYTRENASYVRVRNITLGYNLGPKELSIFKGYIRGIRVFVDF